MRKEKCPYHTSNHERQKPILSAGLGFFSKPDLRKDRIVKTYKSQKDRNFCSILKRHHDVYVKMLKQSGISVPETVMTIATVKNRHVPVITQKAFQERELVRSLMQTGDFPSCLKLLEGLLTETLSFLSYRDRHFMEPFGFHPTLRNYAFHKGHLRYFDTFPPMTGYTQDELGRLMLKFAPFGVFSFLNFFPSRWMRHVTDEYYLDEKMLTGIVGSACRLRPEWAQPFLEHSRHLLSKKIKKSAVRKAVLDRLSKPPRLPFLWILTRTLIGKEGRPNLKRS